MPTHADELHLRLIYRRIAELGSVAANLSQRRQAIAVRNRVTAELVRRGWRVPEIAAALGASYRQVRHWYEEGRTLPVGGLSLPDPAPGQRNRLGPGRLTIHEVARRLRVNHTTIRRWIKDGYLPAARTSAAPQGQWAIEAEALEQLGVPESTATVQEVARQHRVHPMTVREWISRGYLTAVAIRPGGVLRLPADTQRPAMPSAG
jgi:excisionase family DNA binding protein